ncbi:MAG: response regulator transcription factor [Lachnospiraceae bacterium]|nr:response regulator transcription factor [Lachnospiraceae bacterium]
MKKVLLLGDLNQTVSSINKQLSTRFQTQICKDDLELMKGMLKVFDPDLVMVSMVGVGKLDQNILDFLKEKYSKIPVLLVGTLEECRYFQKTYDTEQFDYAVRPTTLSVIMNKCFKLLRMNDTVTAEKEKEGLKSILAVDDSGILLRSVKGMLDKKYDVSVATSGMAAIKQAKKKLPDLILLDYEMPDWDGKRTLEEILKDDELKDVKVVFLTAVTDRAHIEAVLKLKPSGYLLKPIDQTRLIDTIEKVLSGTL